MSINLREVWEQDLSFPFSMALEKVELDLVADYSDFTVVDGEEGDYGDIRYYDESGLLVAVRTVEGGDSEYLTLTENGRLIVKAKIKEMVNRIIDEQLG